MATARDTDPYPSPAEGIVWSDEPNGGAGAWVIRCECGCEQAIVRTRSPSGITTEEATRIGWRFDGLGWTCPMCA